jgi:transketolase C-terminal domain/subunit
MSKKRFGESGTPAELIKHFGMGVKHIKKGRTEGDF